MREIKFRAWCKENKILFNVDDMYWYHEDGTVSHINSATPQNKIERYEVMQFTGLKDKNGTEIYEGDIVNVCDKLNVVICFRGSFYYKDDKMTWKTSVGNCTGETMAEKSEVIGNIYENPE